MSPSGHSERPIHRLALKRTSQAGERHAWSLNRVEPLFVGRVGHCSSDSQFCDPLMRLLEPDEALKAQLAISGDSLPGPERKKSKHDVEVPSTPPPSTSTNYEELVVPDSPEETWVSSNEILLGLAGPERKKSKHVVEVPSTPPPPKSTNYEDLVVPDSPEETWASSNEPPCRSSKLRRASLRKVHTDSMKVSVICGLEPVDHRELSALPASKQNEKLSFESSSVDKNFDHPQQSQIPILAMERRKTTSAIFAEPIEPCSNWDLNEAAGLGHQPCDSRTKNFTNACSGAVPASSSVTACGKPVAVETARLGFGKEEMDNCATLRWHGYQSSEGIRTSRCTINIEGAVPITSFVTGSGKPVSVSSLGLKKARELFGDDDFQEMNKWANLAEAGYQNLPKDVQTPMFADKDGARALSITSFVTGSGKPVSVSAIGMKKARNLFGNNNVQEKQNWAELASAGREDNPPRDVQTPTVRDNDAAVPITSSVTGVGKPLSVSSLGLTTARVSIGNDGVQEKQNWGEVAGAGREDNPSQEVQSPMFRDNDFTVPVTSFVTGSGKPVSVSTTGMKKARELLGDDYQDKQNWDELAEAGYERNPARNVQSPLIRDYDGALPITSFVTGSGKPVYVSSVGLTKARELFGDDGFQEKQNRSKLAGAGYQRNPLRNVQNLLIKDNDGPVATTSFLTGSGKPVSVSSMGLTKARELFGDDGVQDKRNRGEIAGAGYQRNPHEDVQTSTAGWMPGSAPTVSLKKAEALSGYRGLEVSTACGAKLTPFSTASGKPLCASSSAAEKVRKLLGDDQKATVKFPKSLGYQLPGRTTDKNRTVLGNSNLSSAGFFSEELASSSLVTTKKKSIPVSILDTQKEKNPHGDDEKENHVGFGRGASNLGNLQPRQVTEIPEFSADKTGMLRALLQTGAERPIPQTPATAESQRSRPADGETGGSFTAFHRGGQRVQIPQSPSFRTRTGRIVPISAEAIEKARALLADGEKKANHSNESSPSGSCQYTVSKTQNPDEMPTFQAGSESTLTLSSEAMQRAMSLSADGKKKASFHESTGCHSSAAEHANPQVTGPKTTFQTPSGRNISVSSEAIARAKFLLAPKLYPTREKHGVTSLPPEMNRETVKLKSRVSKCRDSKVGASQSPGLNLGNSDDIRSSIAEPSPITVRGDNQLRNVRAFKPPRFVGKESDVGFTSGENLLITTECTASTSGANSCGDHSTSAAFSGRNQLLLPSKSGYFRQNENGSGRSGWMKLREYSRRPPANDSEVLSLSSDVRLMTADAAETHRIQSVKEDGGRESVGSLEVWELMLQLGADSRYASKEWVSNHYKWVVWKLACYERTYPRQAAQKLLTLDTVLHELKCRYDKELSGRRSAIRRITEGDSLASQTMVLCVSAVRHYGEKQPFDHHTGKILVDVVAPYNAAQRSHGNELKANQTAKIELTDGWYRLNAALDAPLTKQLQRGKLKIGQKIQVSGASFSGRPDGTSPLEAFEDVCLMLHMNGTYRAHRDQRLGFSRRPSVPLAFNCIKPGGGLVPQTYVGVTRVYPILFKETSDQGVSVMRSSRAEDKALSQFEQRRAKVMEEAILKLEASHNFSLHAEREEEKIFAAVEIAAEPDILMADMTPAQLKAFAVYQERKDTSRQEAIENAVKQALQEAGLESRNIKRLLKVRVTGLKCRNDSNTQEYQQTKQGTITIWDIGEEQYIQEGSVYCVSGLKPASWVSSRNQDQLQLNSFGSTKWSHVPEATYKKHFLFPYSARALTRLSELDEKFLNREFDVAAMVLQVGAPFSTGAFTNQWVFVTDGSTAKNCPWDTWDETQLLAVRVSMSSLAFVPVENSLVGSVIGFCNLLQQPKDHNRHLWVAEASELAIFSSNLTSLSMRHLQTAANSVSEWAQSTPWMAVQLRDLLQTLMSTS